MIRRAGVVLLAAMAMAVPAYADDDDRPKTRLDLAIDVVVTNAPPAWRNSMSAFNRVRRSVAFGPHIGPYGTFGFSPTSSEMGLSFGLAMYTFDVPIARDWQAFLKETVRSRAQERIKAAGGVEPADLETFVRAIADEVKQEIAHKIQPKALEGPRWKVVTEATALLSEFGWGARIGLSRGARVISLGIGAGVERRGGETTPLFGAELSLHLTPLGKAWTPVLDLYVRVDQVPTGQQQTYALVGARVLLDLL